MNSLLSGPEREVLAAALRGVAVSTEQSGTIDRLIAMGFVRGVKRAAVGGWWVALSAEGQYLARMQRDWSWWERWRDLYSHLQTRAAVMLARDPRRARLLAGRARRAYARAVEALCRVEPDIEREVLGRGRN